MVATDRPTAPPVVRIALVLGTLVALTVVSSSAIAVALGDVQADLSLDVAGSGWIIAAYSLAFSITTPMYGRAADQVGLRLPLTLGLGLFAVGAVVAATAGGFPQLVVGRLVQGAGAGAIPVLVNEIIVRAFDEEQRPTVFGAMTAMVAVVSGSGPLIGGTLWRTLGWRSVLAVPALAVLLLVPLRRLVDQAATRPAGGRFDAVGAALLGTAVAGFVVALQAPTVGYPVGVVVALVAVVVVSLLGLHRWVRRRPGGLLPLAVVRNRGLVWTGLVACSLLGGYLAYLVALPLLLGGRHGLDPLQIGLSLLPAAAVGAIVSRLMGRWSDRLPTYPTVALLGVLSGLGLLAAAVGADVPVVLAAAFALPASAFAGGQVLLLNQLPYLVEVEVRGAAQGVFNLMFFVGGAIGSALTGGLGGLLGLPVALALVALLPFAGALAALRASRLQPSAAGADVGGPASRP